MSRYNQRNLKAYDALKRQYREQREKEMYTEPKELSELIKDPQFLSILFSLVFSLGVFFYFFYKLMYGIREDYRKTKRLREERELRHAERRKKGLPSDTSSSDEEPKKDGKKQIEDNKKKTSTTAANGKAKDSDDEDDADKKKKPASSTTEKKKEEDSETLRQRANAKKTAKGSKEE